MMFDDNTPDAELEPQFQRELLDAYSAGKTVTITLDPIEAFHVLSSLQLALRHPGHTGISADRTRDIATEIERALTAGAPAMQEVARRGWEPRHDV